MVVLIVALLIGRLVGDALLGGVFAAQAAGAVAVIGLPMLGGATPTLGATIAALLAARLVLDARGRDGAVALLRDSALAKLALAAFVWAAASAWLGPRLFAGETIALVPVDGRIVERPLAPTSGNLTQTLYLLLSLSLFFVVAPIARRPGGARLLLRAGLAGCAANVALGLIDALGKASGAGDLLEPFRTAAYALLTNVQEGGFFRIVGGFSEASSFAGFSLAGLAFAYGCWRVSGARFAHALWLVQFGLLALSTSSTAYAGLAVLLATEAARLTLAGLRGRATRVDFAVSLGAWAGAVAALAIGIWASDWAQPYLDLLDKMLLDKATSESGLERMRWNQLSLDSFFATSGLGLGMGSSRASSWAAATLSQLGVVGFAMQTALALAPFVTPLPPGAGPDVAARRALHAGARAGAFGWLLALMISAGSADPGLPFYAFLGAVVGLSLHAPARRQAPQPFATEMSHARR